MYDVEWCCLDRMRACRGGHKDSVPRRVHLEGSSTTSSGGGGICGRCSNMVRAMEHFCSVRLWRVRQNKWSNCSERPLFAHLCPPNPEVIRDSFYGHRHRHLALTVFPPTFRHAYDSVGAHTLQFVRGMQNFQCSSRALDNCTVRPISA